MPNYCCCGSDSENMPLEELLKRYAGAYDVEAVSPSKSVVDATEIEKIVESKIKGELN